MDRAHHLGAVGLAQESEHRNDDEQCLEPLAQQDREGAQEGGDCTPILRCQRAFRLVEQAHQRRDAGPDVRGIAALCDGPAQLAHRGLDPRHQARVASGQHRLDRLEAVEIGGERQILGGVAVARFVGGEALAQLGARDGERRSAGLRRRRRVAPQIGGDRRRLLRPDLARQRSFAETGQSGRVRNQLADLLVAVPDPLALRGEGGRVGEAADVKGKRPFVRLGQLAEALHRGALEALVDDLVIAEQTALPRPVMIGEGDRMGVERGGGGSLRIA